MVLIDIQCGLEKKYETFLNREIRPTLGLFSVILGLFMTKVARVPTHRVGIIFYTKKSFWAKDFESEQKWHGCCSWQYEESGEWYFFVRFFVRVG